MSDIESEAHMEIIKLGSIFKPIPTPTHEEMLSIPLDAHFVMISWPAEESMPDIEIGGSVMTLDHRLELMQHQEDGRYAMVAVVLPPLTSEQSHALALEAFGKEFDGGIDTLRTLLDERQVSAADVLRWMGNAAYLSRVKAVE